MKTKERNKKHTNALKRIEEARQDYKRLWEEVQPFVQKRRMLFPTSAGKWVDSSNFDM